MVVAGPGEYLGNVLAVKAGSVGGCPSEMFISSRHCKIQDGRGRRDGKEELIKGMSLGSKLASECISS